MAGMAEHLAKCHENPVLDDVSCAVRLAQAVAITGFSTSKLTTYAPPRQQMPVMVAHKVMR